MATTVPDLKNYTKINYTNLLADRYKGMNEKYSGRTRRDCPIFRTKSEKLEMAD
jgi:hypothetical protein